MLFHFALLGACESLFSGRTMLKHVHGIEAIDEALHGTAMAICFVDVADVRLSPAPETAAAPWPRSEDFFEETTP